MKKLNFNHLLRELKSIKFAKFDLIVAIGKGGIIPASLIRNILDIDMEILWLNLRDANHNIKYLKPKLTKKFTKIKNKKILLVDDVSRTGNTFQAAKKILKENKIKTFVINGKADYNVMEGDCVKFPWV
ncbi:MAG: phosphoribosyltransferase [Nanoarchaeota archaeon]